MSPRKVSAFHQTDRRTTPVNHLPAARSAFRRAVRDRNRELLDAPGLSADDARTPVDLPGRARWEGAVAGDIVVRVTEGAGGPTVGG